MRQYVGASGPVSLSDAESAVRELIQDFATSFNTGNYDHCAAIFAGEAQLILPYRETTQGQRAIEHTLRELADNGYQDLRLQTIRVDAAGDRAMELGNYTVMLHLANGRVVADHGNYVAFWRRLGVWRIVAHCFSSSVPRNWQDVQPQPLHAVGPLISNDVQRRA